MLDRILTFLDFSKFRRRDADRSTEATSDPRRGGVASLIASSLRAARLDITDMNFTVGIPVALGEWAWPARHLSILPAPFTGRRGIDIPAECSESAVGGSR